MLSDCFWPEAAVVDRQRSAKSGKRLLIARCYVELLAGATPWIKIV
jgi:hypothetical protein